MDKSAHNKDDMAFPPRRNQALILLVNDDPVPHSPLSAALKTEGFNVAHACDEEQAVNLAQQQHPDLMLIDATMDEIDGFELCRQMQRMEKHRWIPVVILLHMDNTTQIDHAYEAGARDVLGKTDDDIVLVRRLKFILRNRDSERRLRDYQSHAMTAHRLAGVGYWHYDIDNDVLEISEQLAQMCGGIASRSLSLREFACLIQPQDRLLFQQSIDNAQLNAQDSSAEYRLLKKNGDSLLVRQDIALFHHAPERFMIASLLDISRQKAAEEKIRKMAYYDTLTGLASRSYFMQHLKESLASAKRHRERLSLMFIDLDEFKDINDALGHNVGDYLLTEIARRLRSALRDSDFVARLGGDEFCVLLDEYHHHHDIAKLAEKCLQLIGQPIELDSREYSPKASMGIATFPDDAGTMHNLLKAADSAMYAAKQEGKHRYAFYDPEMTAKAEQRMILEMELKQAFSNQEFELYYQPQISFSTERVVALEALVRWNHPQRGRVMPDQFIAVLEQMGMITALGDWVISQACLQLRQWIDQGLGEIGVAVNISPQHFSEGCIAKTVSDSLDAHNIHAQLLEIEITESSVHSGEHLEQSFAELKQIGVSIAIDDFGTGYSSLGSLKKLPVDCLKIDRIFVKDLARHTDDNIMLGTIIGMAHALNYKVVAEGVETAEQALILAGLGCDLAQGYYYSHPLPADEIPPLFFRTFPLLKQLSAATGK